MGKYITLLIGAAFIILGFLGIGIWKEYLISILKGSIPLALLLIGLACFFAGLGEIKDASKKKK